MVAIKNFEDFYEKYNNYNSNKRLFQSGGILKHNWKLKQKYKSEL